MAYFIIFPSICNILVAILKPYDVAVTDIESNSAIIHWKTTEMSTRIEKFRVNNYFSKDTSTKPKINDKIQIRCNGTRHYVSMDGQHLLDADEKVQYAPSGKDYVLIGDLQANCNYSCTVQEGISPPKSVLYGEISSPCHFTTDYGGILCYFTAHVNR